jgi:regulator of replication initiation timing
MNDFEIVRKIYEEYVRDSGLNRATLLEEALARIEVEVERLRQNLEACAEGHAYLKKENERLRSGRGWDR